MFYLYQVCLAIWLCQLHLLSLDDLPKPHAAQTFFEWLKDTLPHLLQTVWTLFWRLPCDGVPLVIAIHLLMTLLMRVILYSYYGET